MGAAEHDRQIAAMFDTLAPRYDFLNRVLSFGVDLAWRRRAVALAELGPGQRALDVGSGTGDLAFALVAACPRARAVIGVDLSAGMLAIAARRAAELGVAPRYTAVRASADALPFADGSLDRIVSGFTLRNLGDLSRGLADMRRVLRPGGRAVLLELSHPPGPFGALYRVYFEAVLPRIAVLLGGDPGAYRYLPRSLRAFPTAEALAEQMRHAGFRGVWFEHLTRGIAAIHVGGT